MLYELLEGIYDKRFKHEMEYIRKCLNKFAEDEEKKEPSVFYQYFYNTLMKDYKGNRKTAETKILNILASLEHFCGSFAYFQLFKLFLNNDLTSLELNCFLLLRFMILKDIETRNKKLKYSKVKLHLHNHEITVKSCKKYLFEMFKDCEQIDTEDILEKVFPADKKMMNAYEFLIAVIDEYKKVRKTSKEGEEEIESRLVESELTQNSGNKDNINESSLQNSQCNVQTRLREEMRYLVDKFIESLTNENFSVQNREKSINDIKNIIFSKLDNLLIALFDGNQNAWFKELLIEQPEQENIEYAMELFQDYIYLYNNQITNADLLKEFCKKILKTPEVNNQISSFLTYVFGNNEEEESMVNEQYEEESDEYIREEEEHKQVTNMSAKFKSVEYNNEDSFNKARDINIKENYEFRSRDSRNRNFADYFTKKSEKEDDYESKYSNAYQKEEDNQSDEFDNEFKKLSETLENLKNSNDDRYDNYFNKKMSFSNEQYTDNKEEQDYYQNDNMDKHVRQFDTFQSQNYRVYEEQKIQKLPNLRPSQEEDSEDEHDDTDIDRKMNNLFLN